MENKENIINPTIRRIPNIGDFVACGRCGNVLLPTDIVCPKCGTKVGELGFENKIRKVVK